MTKQPYYPKLRITLATFAVHKPQRLRANEVASAATFNLSYAAKRVAAKELAR